MFNIFSFFCADDIEPWMIWGYYVSPMMYGQNAIAINEFLDDRWSTVISLKSLSTKFSLYFNNYNFEFYIRFN